MEGWGCGLCQLSAGSALGKHPNHGNDVFSPAVLASLSPRLNKELPAIYLWRPSLHLFLTVLAREFGDQGFIQPPIERWCLTHAKDKNVL